MHLLQTILRARLRTGGRWLAEHAFALVVLGPLILGGLFWVVDRYVPIVGDALRGMVTRSAEGVPGPMALALSLLLTATALAGAVEELFPRRSPTLWLDWLPVPAGVRFLAAWTARASAAFLPVLAMLAVCLLLARHGAEEGAVAPVEWLLRLALAMLPLIGLELVAALVLIHLRWLRAAPVLALASVLVAATFFSPTWPWLAWLLLPWLPSAAQIETVLGASLSVEPTGSVWAAWWWPLAMAAVLYALGGGLARRWQRSDLSVAHAPARPPRPWARRSLLVLTGRLNRPVAAQVVRDGLLVLRRFSPAVDVAMLLALLSLAGATTWIERTALSPFGDSRVLLLGSVGAALCLVALVPFVLRHELPHLWVERSAGIDAQALWRAKLWLARLLALPALVAGCLLLLRVPATPGDYAIYCVELVASCWIVSSLVGIATFEIAERPLLGLIFSALVAFAWAALMIAYRQFAPYWLIGYAIVAASIADRATHRVRFTRVLR